MKIKNFFTKTPFVSILFFIGYICFFLYLINNFYIDKYEKIEHETVRILEDEPVIVIDNINDYVLYVEQPVQIVYSSQEQVLKGYIKDINDDKIYIYVNKLFSLTDEEIENIQIKVLSGKEPIRRYLDV